jgi:hypothetical protein
MKTFKQYISEADENELSRLHMVDVLNRVKADCQQFLHRAAGAGKFHGLYTGLQTARWPDCEVQVRKDKAPIPTPKRIQDTFDRVMRELYSKEFRSDAFFATGSPAMSDERGIKHLVFPIGKFEYLWSEKQADLIYGFGSEEDLVDEKGLYFDMQEAEGEEAEDKVLKAFLKDNEFKLNQELRQCADKKHEVMIDCKYYYAIPSDKIHEHYDTFVKMIGEIHFIKSMKSDLLN